MNADNNFVASGYNLRSGRKINYTNIYNHVVDAKITDKNTKYNYYRMLYPI